MNRLIHIGFGNIVNTSKIIAIVSPDSAPVKRLVQKAKESGTVIDATQGRRTKSVLVMESSQIVLSALLPETIAGRAQGALSDEDTDETIENGINKLLKKRGKNMLHPSYTDLMKVVNNEIGRASCRERVLIQV